MDGISHNLINQTRTICQDARFRDTILRHSVLQKKKDIHPQHLNLAIPAADQMLIHSLQHHQNASVALSQYFNVSMQQFNAARQILMSCFDTEKENIKVLDFACGYGRLLRFLSLWLPKTCIWASEVQPDALEFVTKAFGVQGLLSNVDPKKFDVDDRFDFVWVASLFSHLPDNLFSAWLEKLISLLSPRGVLCFSVRGSELMQPGDQLPEKGIFYVRASEIATLAADVYGTTYASDSYVQEAIQRLLGRGHRYGRLRRALANEQDLYLVARDAARDLPTLNTFRRGPWGWVDQLELSDSGDLDMQGWAASMDGCGLESVEIRINERRHSVMPTFRREGVAEVFQDRRLAHSGWAFHTRLDSGMKDTYVEVSARTAQDGLALLYAGAIESGYCWRTLGVEHRDGLQRQAEQLNEAMEVPGCRFKSVLLRLFPVRLSGWFKLLSRKGTRT